ncbi:metallophosphoesterase [Phragmitibacter flavus]|nr:metallophosphoesterase [Phragmitibacter flavus]
MKSLALHGLAFFLCATSTLAADRLLIDFGNATEQSPSPDLFNRHWNLFSALNQSPINPATRVDGSPWTGVSLTITDAFRTISTNNNGGELIYNSAATSDFWFVQKADNAVGAIRIDGLDPSGNTVYDIKAFVSSNRSAPEVFNTLYTATGANSASATLEAIDNISNVASIPGIIPNASGQITVRVELAANSTTYGAISVLELIARAPTDPITPDPQPNRYAAVGQTPNPPSTVSTANPEGLRAYVYESPDSFTSKLGLGELLRRAGFHVMPLPLNQPPYVPGSDPETDVDLIAIGSFASENPEYQAYMATYADDLDDFIDRAGLLIQFSQADQHEPSPPFLPDTQAASRVDTDFDSTFILVPDHSLLANVPTAADGKSLSFTLSDDSVFYRTNTSWETFDQFSGFEVILSGDPKARFPALMEGAYGQGRFFVSSLAVDKILNASTGADVSTTSQAAFNTPFFTNLYDYTALVRDRQTPPINITPQPGDSLIEDGAWTLVLLPDTQIYSQNYPGVFEAQTSWIYHNRRARNIRFVLHLGDIVNVNSRPEWENARRAFRILDNQVPYAFVPGNHDYGPGGNAATRDTFMNDYFKEELYRLTPAFGGVMETGKMDNSYHFFNAGGVNFIVMCFEWGPRDSTIAWADGILQQYPQHKAILVTHAYMNNNDFRYDISDSTRPQAYNPHNYTTPGGVNDGEELWQKLVRKHNFVLTVNGHVLGDGTGYRVDNNDAGNPVHQMLINYQFRNLGGEGYLRTLEFQPDGQTVVVKSYSPILNNYLLTTDQDFSFDLPLGAADQDNDGILDYFDADFDDDLDGLDNFNEFVIHGTSSSTADTDADGLSDLFESTAGSNPLSNERAYIDLVRNNREQFGLYTEDEIGELRPGGLLIKVEDDMVELNLQLKQSPNLQPESWQNAGPPVEWSIPVDPEFRFFRVKINDGTD